MFSTTAVVVPLPNPGAPIISLTAATYSFTDLSLPAEGVILRSSDDVDFKVYKNILALASPFFTDMFSLPQPPKDETSTSSNTAEQPAPLQVVDVAENSGTLNTLLRLVYPLPPPTFPGALASGAINKPDIFIKGVEPVLAAALKYDMSLVVRALCAKLIEAAEKTLPDGSVADDTLVLRVFAIACRYRLKEEAYAAAHATLRGRVAGVFFSELRDMSAAHYFHLIQFHTKIVDAVTSIIKTSGLPNPYADLIKCSRCESGNGDYYDCSVWWLDFVGRSLPILCESPRSMKVSSAGFLQDMFSQANTCSKNEAPSGCRDVHGKWQTMSQFIRDTVDSAIANNDIDLSEL